MPTKKTRLNGSRQRRTRFDPKADEVREEATRALRWGEVADRPNREAILPMSKTALERARGKLMRRGMEVRTGPNGREWKLYRGEGRCDVNKKFEQRASWSPYASNAQKFAKYASEKYESCPHRTVAWVPEESVLSIPLMYGNQGQGRFLYQSEAEVVVEPFRPGASETTPFDPEFQKFYDRLFAFEPGEDETPTVARARLERLKTKAADVAKTPFDKSLLKEAYELGKVVLKQGK